MSPDRIAGIAIAIVVVIAVGGGFWLLGSPRHQQQLALDTAKIVDLESIRSTLSHHALPEHLRATYPRSYNFAGSVSTLGYRYHRIDATHYELCATFFEPAPASEVMFPHGSGLACYVIDANEDLPRGIQPGRVTDLGGDA
jgi:hypothetical protein